MLQKKGGGSSKDLTRRQEKLFESILQEVNNAGDTYFENLTASEQPLDTNAIQDAVDLVEKLDQNDMSAFLRFVSQSMEHSFSERKNILTSSQSFILQHRAEIEDIYAKFEKSSISDQEKLIGIRRDIDALIENQSLGVGRAREMKVAVSQILSTAPAAAMTIAMVNILSEAISQPLQNLGEITEAVHEFGKNVYLLSPEGIGPLAQELSHNLTIMAPKDAFEIFHKAVGALFKSEEVGNLATVGMGGLFLAGELVKPGGLVDIASKTFYALADAASKLSLAFSVTTACLRVPFAILSIAANIKIRNEVDKLKYAVLENVATLEETKSQLRTTKRIQAMEDKPLIKLSALRPAIVYDEKRLLTIPEEMECLDFFASRIEQLNKEIELERHDLNHVKKTSEVEGLKSKNTNYAPSIKDSIMQAFGNAKSGLIVSSDGYLDSSRYEVQPILDPFDPDNAKFISFTKGNKLESRAKGGTMANLRNTAASLLTTDKYQLERLQKRQDEMAKEHKMIQAYVARHDTSIPHHNSDLARTKDVIQSFVESDNNLVQGLADLLQTKRELEAVVSSIIIVRKRRSELDRMMRSDALVKLAEQTSNKKFLAIASKIKDVVNKQEPAEQTVVADLKVALSDARIAMASLASKMGYTKQKKDIPSNINTPIKLTQEFMDGVDKLIDQQVEKCVDLVQKQRQAKKYLVKKGIAIENTIVNTEGVFDPSQPLTNKNNRAKAIAKYNATKLAMKAPNRAAFEAGSKGNVVIPRSDEVKVYLPLHVTDKDTGESILIRTTKIKKEHILGLATIPHTAKAETIAQYKKMKKIDKKIQKRKKILQKMAEKRLASKEKIANRYPDSIPPSSIQGSSFSLEREDPATDEDRWSYTHSSTTQKLPSKHPFISSSGKSSDWIDDSSSKLQYSPKRRPMQNYNPQNQQQLYYPATQELATTTPIHSADYLSYQQKPSTKYKHPDQHQNVKETSFSAPQQQKQLVSKGMQTESIENSSMQTAPPQQSISTDVPTHTRSAKDLQKSAPLHTTINHQKQLSRELNMYQKTDSESVNGNTKTMGKSNIQPNTNATIYRRRDPNHVFTLHRNLPRMSTATYEGKNSTTQIAKKKGLSSPKHAHLMSHGMIKHGMSL